MIRWSEAKEWFVRDLQKPANGQAVKIQILPTLDEQGCLQHA